MLAGEVGAAGNAIGKGVESRIAAEVIDGAFEIVGAGLHGDAEGAAGGVAEFGVNGILLEVDFAHRVHGGRIGRLLAGHGRGAIENDVVLVGGAAADVELGGGPMVERALFGGGTDDHGGVERGQQEGVAMDDGQVVGHLGIDGQAHGGVVELHGGSGSFDGDGFGGGTGLETGVDGDVGAGLDGDVLLDELVEAGVFDGHGISTGNDEVEKVLAIRAGLRFGGDAGIVVEKRDGGANDDGIGGVDDAALDFTAGVLRPGGGDGEQQGAREEDFS